MGKKSHETMKTKPACVSWHDYELWHQAARLFPSGLVSGFCTDCTPEFQEKTMMAGTCEHHELYFIRDTDGFIEGRTPASKAAMRKAKKTGRLVKVDA